MPRCTFHGEVDPYVWTWEVGSFTNPKTSYTVVIDMGSGETRCDCMDSVCRRNRYRPSLLDACKHARWVQTVAKRRLRGKE